MYDEVHHNRKADVDIDNKNDSALTKDIILQSLENNSYLTMEQKILLCNLIFKYRNTFSERPGLCNKYSHKLTVTNPEYFKPICYPVPLTYQDAVNQEISRMEELGIIERSKSNFINPIIPVIKKTGEIRLCLDARKANDIIVPDYECNRSVHEILAKCRHSKFISGIDLTSSYWQIKLTDDSKQYTAFQFRGRTYHYKVTPFGISTSQAALVRALDLVFNDTVENFTAIYVDDICVISPDFETHLLHLEYIFRKLQEANMTIRFDKSKFCHDSIQFLGYTLTNDGLQMDESKIEPILKFPSPKNRTQLKAFLGSINYYNKFLDKFSTTVQPILRLTSKKVKFTWTDADEQTFSNIKQLFLNTQVLSHPNVNKEFFLQTDASEYAIGGHLFQFKENGDKAALMFMSRSLQLAEQHFTTTEKELLAILFCLQKARYLVLGAKLTIITDNHALTFLKTCKLLSHRLTRWILTIQEYHFNIVHCKGSENTTADTLSRIPIDTPLTNCEQTPELIVPYIDRTTDPSLQYGLRNINELQNLDDELSPIIKILTQQPQNLENQKTFENYRLHEGTLYKRYNEKWLVTVPKSMIGKLVWQCHEHYLHCGSRKCIQLLLECFTFRNMSRIIRKLLATCDICQRCKINNRPLFGLAKGVTCSAKNDQIAVDFIGPLPTSIGNVKYMLIVIDIFTKFVKLYPIQKATTRSIINKLFNTHFPQFGLPKRIQSDNGSQFKSEKWFTKLEQNDILPIYSPVYYPRVNLAERPIKEVKRCLRTYCSNRHTKWVKYIPDINDCLNEIYHEATGFTPNELQLGIRDKRFWEDFIDNPFTTDLPLDQKLLLATERLNRIKNKRADRLNSKHNPQTLEVHEKVLVKSHPLSRSAFGETAKLFEIYHGPYTIHEQLGNTTYNVYDEASNNVLGPYHVSALKRYLSPLREIYETNERNVNESQD